MSESRILMIASSIMLLAAGVLTSFLPQELLQWMGTEVSTVAVLAIQLLGALYLGFAAVNWMARGVLVGGIYARPLSLGNFGHFMIGAITLVKLVLNDPDPALIGLTLPYLVFALWFGRILFRPPAA